MEKNTHTKKKYLGECYKRLGVGLTPRGGGLAVSGDIAEILKWSITVIPRFHVKGIMFRVMQYKTKETKKVNKIIKILIIRDAKYQHSNI